MRKGEKKSPSLCCWTCPLWPASLASDKIILISEDRCPFPLFMPISPLTPCPLLPPGVETTGCVTAPGSEPIFRQLITLKICITHPPTKPQTTHRSRYRLISTPFFQGKCIELPFFCQLEYSVCAEISTWRNQVKYWISNLTFPKEHIIRQFQLSISGMWTSRMFTLSIENWI